MKSKIENRKSKMALLAQAAAKIDVRKALRVLQTEMRRRFGKNASSIIGNNTLYISPDRIELTDDDSRVVAKGHCRVATVLVRRRRTPAHARDRAHDRSSERKAK